MQVQCLCIKKEYSTKIIIFKDEEKTTLDYSVKAITEGFAIFQSPATFREQG